MEARIPEPDLLRDRLLSLAAETHPSHPLATAGELLWKAEIRQTLESRQKRAERIVRPATWAQIGGLTTGAATLLLFIGLQATSWLGGATSDLLSVSALVALFLAAPAAALLVMLRSLRRKIDA